TCAAPDGATCSCTWTYARRPSSTRSRSASCASSPAPVARRSRSCPSRAASSPECGTPSTATRERVPKTQLVSVPLFLVDARPPGSDFVLDGPEGHHAATVQRRRAGESLLLGDGRGGTATAVVTAVGRGTLELSITTRGYVPPPARRLIVVQGIAKG